MTGPGTPNTAATPPGEDCYDRPMTRRYLSA
jgi:hypothetical protein